MMKAEKYINGLPISEYFLLCLSHDLLRQVISNKEAVFDNSMAEQLLNYDEGRKIY